MQPEPQQTHTTHMSDLSLATGPASLAQRFKGQSSMWRFFHCQDTTHGSLDPEAKHVQGVQCPTRYWRELLGIIIMRVASASPDYSSVYIYIMKNYTHDMILTHYISSLLWTCGIWTLPSKNSHQIWQTLDIQCLYNATIYAAQMSDCIGLQNLACAVSGLQNQNQSNYCCPWHAFEETWFTFSCWPWKIYNPIHK